MAGSDRISEWRHYQLCGIMLLFMNQTLAGIVGFIVYQNRGYDYSGFLIYAMAVYIFYITIIAVIQLIKFKRYGSPGLVCGKSRQSHFFRRMMADVVGGGVCLLVLGIAIVMIVRSTKQLKRPEENGKVQASLF